uniref:Plastid-encoded RNA polymerase subunit alpha n=1 Tax=Discoplastis spathirhyncha TaxID=215771 RepID=A0A3G3LLA6_9EUGL|nr:RNA polymerase alpha subunit [Discoplastis spathirhyncha]AYQ93495.1 RNA polymerase alpha subunit [Discoplastis spathirhyncha]
MKLIKLIILKNTMNNKSHYGLFQIISSQKTFNIKIGNLIRRELIKNTPGLKITKTDVFIKKYGRNKLSFKKLNEYLKVKEIKEPIAEIISNISDLKLIRKNNIFESYIKEVKTNIFKGPYEIKNKDLFLNEKIKVLFPENVITNIKYPMIDIIFIMKIEMRSKQLIIF